MRWPAYRPIVLERRDPDDVVGAEHVRHAAPGQAAQDGTVERVLLLGRAPGHEVVGVAVDLRRDDPADLRVAEVAEGLGQEVAAREEVGVDLGDDVVLVAVGVVPGVVVAALGALAVKGPAGQVVLAPPWRVK